MRSYRSGVGIFVGVILLLLGVWFFLYHQAARSFESLKESADLIETQEGRQTEHSRLKKQLADTQAERLKLLGYFIDRESIVVLIEQLEQLGQRTGAKVEVVSASEDEPIRLSIRISGNFPNVLRTLELAEKIPYALSVERSTLMKAEDAGAEWEATLTIILHSLTQHEKKS
ncbi:MAG TPA: hypothetical protein VEB60_02820 [Candidatus Paceibacterota bacterium]|nr:hypothetical protein [Candidatus Paceibacterota bacterium]